MKDKELLKMLKKSGWKRDSDGAAAGDFKENRIKIGGCYVICVSSDFSQRRGDLLGRIS